MEALFNNDLPDCCQLMNSNKEQYPEMPEIVFNRHKISVIILEMAQKALESQFDDKQFRFTVTVRWIPASLLAMNPESIVAVTIAGKIEHFTNFEVHYRQSGQSRLQISQIQLQLDIEKKLPVANRRMMYGEVLEKKYLHHQWVKVQNTRDRYIASESVLIGKTLRRSLAAGQPIRYTDIASEFVVHAGEDVNLLFEKDGILIVITAEARQDGEQDETITVYSKKTRTRYLGRIKKPGVVKWEKTL